MLLSATIVYSINIDQGDTLGKAISCDGRALNKIKTCSLGSLKSTEEREKEERKYLKRVIETNMNK